MSKLINSPAKNNGKGSHSNKGNNKSCGNASHIYSLNCLRYFAKENRIKTRQFIRKILTQNSLNHFFTLKALSKAYLNGYSL